MGDGRWVMGGGRPAKPFSPNTRTKARHVTTRGRSYVVGHSLGGAAAGGDPVALQAGRPRLSDPDRAAPQGDRVAGANSACDRRDPAAHPALPVRPPDLSCADG